MSERTDPEVGDIFQGARRVSDWPAVTPKDFQETIAAAHMPAVMRAQTASWPAVLAAQSSNKALLRYLLTFDTGSRAELFVGTPEMEGRFFYDDDVSAFNFSKAQAPLRKLLENLSSRTIASTLPPIYMGSTPVRQVLPGFELENELALVSGKPTEPRLWIGNQSRVAPHFDETENVACVVAGRRRFVLFPPDQVRNLYVGPLDFTMAGQPASWWICSGPTSTAIPGFAAPSSRPL